MNKPSREDHDKPSEVLFDPSHPVAVEFLARWTESESDPNADFPRAEEFLEHGPASEQPALLEELLGIELKARQMHREPISVADYRRRFPGHEDLVERLVVRFRRNVANKDASTSPSVQDLSESTVAYKVDRSKDRMIGERHGKAEAQQVYGDYEILGPIGAGGMGQVFKARHRVMNRIVALKIMASRISDSPSALKRFQREVRTAAQLSHPNIISAYDARFEKQTLYLVMEYVEGVDLSDFVQRNGPLELQRAIDHIVDAAMGMQYAHEEGVIHRDIKPANLLLDSSGTVRVLDLGLARLTLKNDSGTKDSGTHDSDTNDPNSSNSGDGESSLNLTSSQAIMGTFDYMAPEQAVSSRDADERSDIYSLGCTLHFLLSGKPVYSGDTEVEKLIAHREQKIPSLHKVRPDLPKTIDSVFERMIAKRPEQRYQTMAEVVDALRLLRDDGPNTAVPRTKLDSTVSHVQKGEPATKRSRWMTATALGILFVVIAAFMVGVALRHGPALVEKNSKERPKPNPPAPGSLVVDQAGKSDPDDVVDERAGSGSSTVDQDDPQVTQPVPVVGRYELEGDDPQSGRGWLPGLFLRPAELPGGGQRQLQTVWPRDLHDRIDSIALSPDGRWLACGTNGGIIRLYEIPQLRLAGIFAAGDQVESLAWSPDGRWIAAGIGKEGLVKFWESDGTPGTSFHAHSDRVVSLDWSPDSKWLASASYDETVKLYAPDGQRGSEWTGHVDDVLCVAWSPDGNWLASGGRDDTLRLWRPDGTPGPVLGHTDQVQGIAWSADGKWIASRAADKIVRFWSQDGTERAATEVPAFGGIDDLKWGPETMPWLAVLEQRQIRFFDPNGTHRSSFNHDLWGSPGEMAWSQNDGRLLVVVYGVVMQVFELEKDPPIPPQAVAAINTDSRATVTMPHYHIRWSPDASCFATADSHAICVWNSDGTKKASIKKIDDDRPKFAWSPDGQRLAFIDRSHRIHLWNRDGTPGPKTKAGAEPLYGFGKWGLSWAPTGRWLAVAMEDTSIRIFQPDGTPHEKLIGHTAIIESLAWSPDGEWLASTSRNGTVRLWKADGTEGPVMNAHGKLITCGEWSHDGKWLATASLDKTVRLWSVDGQPGPMLQCDNPVNYATWSPDGRLAFGQEKSVVFWNPESNEQITLTFPNYIRELAWSPDGKMLVGLSDHAIFAWDVKTMETQWVTVIVDHNHVVFDASGELLHGDPDVVDEQLIYAVQTESGRIELQDVRVR